MSIETGTLAGDRAPIRIALYGASWTALGKPRSASLFSAVKCYLAGHVPAHDVWLVARGERTLTDQCSCCGASIALAT
jgi:hypothetical protein